ncbi:MAG: DUF3313 family protein [Candidatus Omnitrophica bacterium]|nr:DUF3313 family protein [Candidatus Omnitrophota bacterium]
MNFRKVLCSLGVLLVGALVLVSGCVTDQAATRSGFLNDYSVLKKGKHFNEEHVSSGAKFSEYNQVKVAPIDFSYLADKTACSTDELETLGREFREVIEKKLTESGFTISANPLGKTLVVKLAVTNIEPPNVAFNVAAAVFCPVPGIDSDGCTSLEGKIVDGATGKTMIEFAETQSGSGKGINVKAMAVGGFTKFTNTESVFKGWATGIASMLSDLKTGAEPNKKSETKS